MGNGVIRLPENPYLMKAALPLVLLVVAVDLSSGPSAEGDTSPKRRSVDPRRFELLRTLKGPPTSHLSPSGQFILTYKANNCTITDVRTGKRLGELTGHGGRMHDAYFSRDGKLVATASYDATVRIWDTATQKELQVIEAHSGYC